MASPCSLCFLLVREDDILSSNSGTVLQWGSHQHHLLTPAHTKYIAHFNFYHTQLNFIETFGNSILKHWSISLHPTLLKAWYLLLMWLNLRNLCYKTKYLNTPSAKTSILKLKRVFLQYLKNLNCLHSFFNGLLWPPKRAPFCFVTVFGFVSPPNWNRIH